MENKGVPQADILRGWKEISTYLRIGVRTVQRYEQQFGLPVRRPAGKRRGSVIATTAELDAWLAARPTREAFRWQRSTSISAAPWSDFRAGLAKMVRLRGEMMRLRTEIEASLEALRDNLQVIQGDMSREVLPKIGGTPIWLTNGVEAGSPFKPAAA